MMVEDPLDRCVERIGGVDQLEEFDELAAGAAVLDQGVNLSGQQINAGHETDPVARDGWMRAKPGRQVLGPRSRSPECLASRRWR
jgi:hypothetical protein